MKIITIFLVFLLSIGLCSCSNTLQEKTNTKEQLSDTEIMLDEINAEEPTAAEPVSIVFMGETIPALGLYPGVPDVYAPVLDDLYLYGALSQRYSVLHYDGKVTQEIMRERERVQDEIRQRGYLPYPGDGLGITGGYALVDLDDDGSLELLIINKSPHYKQDLVIKSIFAIRNGRLVCIDNGSSELNYTILAADGTFYQCIDWHGTGYTDLIAFCLEAGMSEFTTISEARAALSFLGGDVPVPYWVKIENGNEINITKDEFNAILDQYENPKEWMVLDFVPLHPDAIDPWSVPRPTDEPPTIPIEYPITYQDALEAYKPILDALFLLAEHMRREEYGSGEDLGIVGFSEYPCPRDSALGYALVDLNNDGVLELLLGSIDGLNDAAPNSIFTLKNGQPMLIRSFWSRSRGVISANGIIYSAGSGGAAYTYLSSFRLDKNADTLTQLTDMRSEYSHSEEKPYYVQVMEDGNHYISEQEFFDSWDMYNDPPERMKLTFIPIVSSELENADEMLSGVKSWQNTYAAFLKSSENYTEDKHFAGDFALVDIDNSGVPELIIVYYNGHEGGRIFANIYSYDEKINIIGQQIDMYYKQAWPSINPSFQGLFVDGGRNSTFSGNYWTIINNEFIDEPLWSNAYNPDLNKMEYEDLSNNEQLIAESKNFLQCCPIPIQQM